MKKQDRHENKKRKLAALCNIIKINEHDKEESKQPEKSSDSDEKADSRVDPVSLTTIFHIRSYSNDNF